MNQGFWEKLASICPKVETDEANWEYWEYESVTSASSLGFTVRANLHIKHVKNIE